MPGTTDLILIRHAPARSGGRLAGRLDVPADLPGPEVLARARPRTPEARTTSTSMVGLPRESRISRALISTIWVLLMMENEVS